MNRTFDKAIEGLRKLKGDPVHLTPETPDLTEEVKQAELLDDQVDDDTYVISPFSDSDVLKTGRRSEATFISTSPESDEGIEVSWPTKEEERERFLGEKFFLLWKNNIAKQKLKFSKACLFSDLNTKVSVFQQWKEVVRKQKTQRKLEEKQREIQKETIKHYLAQKYRERNLCSKVFSSWLLLARIKQQKKKVKLKLSLSDKTNDLLRVRVFKTTSIRINFRACFWKNFGSCPLRQALH